MVKGLLLSRSGFTLVEMAVVIVIMGLVMMTVLPALISVRSANQAALTQSNLRSLMLTTAAYVQANGCLPCPAVAGGTGTNFGKLGYASATVACGICNAPEGIPPFVALGIPAAAAHDGWGHWITMRVDPALTALPNSPGSVFTPPWAPCTASDIANGLCTQINTSSKGFCAANLSKTNRISVTMAHGATQQAAVIFVSHGKDGYGSYKADPGSPVSYLYPFPSNYGACNPPYGGFAQCNSAKNNSKQFYDAPIVVSNDDPYDDVLAYADRNALVSMLGSGACSTAW